MDSETQQKKIKNFQMKDAMMNLWVYRILPDFLWPYAQLARWDRSVGWWLLLWPCWWSLSLALKNGKIEDLCSQLLPEWPFIFGATVSFSLFGLGAITMRGAGCTYNDIVDVDIDMKVTRTVYRPISSGRVKKSQAKYFLLLQAIIGALILLALCCLGRRFNSFAMCLGIISLVIIALYPFAKRVTYWPQLILGLAFSWGGLMGWAVLYSSLSTSAYFLYIGSIFWVIGYDTIYAHQDKEDDILVGVKSTALLFKKKQK